ncbi:MAG: 3-oxoacyl-[acyl-carrier-protein] synthase III C-terminal domain-containing protein [Dehalococcoidales bacterium]|nr:3-oxoacyl-[acyl-carrier-protein] synthase III C-terminal domain-containing protein [Dehalococcoidales bacterium]
MSKVKVISLGYAVPEFTYTQEKIFEVLGYPRPFFRMFRDAQINKRYFCLPLEKIKTLSFQEQQEQYAKWAVQLSCEAIVQCLDGRDVQDIGCITYGSCTGLMPGPSASHYIGAKFNMSPSVYHSNIIGQGCESGFPGLKRGFDFVQSSGKMALVVNCELCDLTYFPENGKPDQGDGYSLMRANALFGDAAVACLVGHDDDWRHPTIIDTETYIDHTYLNDLGYRWQNGRLRAVISRRVPDLAAEVAYKAMSGLLSRTKLDSHQVKWWVIHAAGSGVLDNIRDAIGLSEEQIKLSRETLKNFGNTSSTSVGITGKHLMFQDIKQDDYLMMLSIGPGMTGGATLCRFQ